MHIILIDVRKGKRRIIRSDEKGTHTAYGRIPRRLAEKYIGRYIPGKPLAVAKLSLREAAYAPKKFRYATQIIYPEDWGTIVTFADITPEKEVLEAGTGSGFLASFLTRHAKKVYTYEIREDHYRRAVKNLRYLARKNARIAYNEDVRNAKEIVDVIVLDLPNPREVVPSLRSNLRPGGWIAILVPTYNQVERTYKTLKELGFVNIIARESIVRDLSLKPNAIRPEVRGIVFRIFTIFARLILSRAF